MSDDNLGDEHLGKVYDEDGYCVACGNGRWKHHMPQCEIADLIDALRWTLRDGRAHGVSVCVCVDCEDARATLARYDAAPEHIDGEAGDGA